MKIEKGKQVHEENDTLSIKKELIKTTLIVLFAKSISFQLGKN